MIIPSGRYTRSSFPTLVFCGTNRISYSLIKDEASWEEFSEDTVSSYLESGTQTFIENLTSFTKNTAPYSSCKAKELRFMLEALIEVKEIFGGEGSVARYMEV